MIARQLEQDTSVEESSSRAVGHWVLWTISAVGCLAAVLWFHGLLPGMVNSGPVNALAEASIRCTEELGIKAVWERCHAYGEPAGYPYLSNGPVIYLGALLSTLPGVGSYAASQLAHAALDAAALAGGWWLARQLGISRGISLLTSATFLITPTVVGMQGFIGTDRGVALLPAYAAIHLWAARRMTRIRGPVDVLRTALPLVATNVAAVFLDGYTFVMTAAIGACLWLAASFEQPIGWARRFGAAGLYLVSLLVAYLSYEWYSPVTFSKEPVEFFRAMSLDVSTLVSPSGRVWWADIVGVASDKADLWGDSTNNRYNYLGFVFIALAGVGCYVTRGRKVTIALVVATAVAVGLSIGPSLKVDNDIADLAGTEGFRIYSMPAGVATLDLPWGGLFTSLPGLDAMRAIYRWIGLARLGVVFLAGLGISELRRSGRRLLPYVLALVAVVEIVPNATSLNDSYRATYESTVSLRDQVVGDLTHALDDGEFVFFLGADGSFNDFLAGSLATAAGVRTFNAGADKNLNYSVASWPPEIAAIANPTPTGDGVDGALASGTVDVVIAPFFDLANASVLFPPPSDQAAIAAAHWEPLLSDPRFAVERYDWFATIRPGA